MTSAPSGHLVAPCDHDDKANKVKHDDHLVFMTDHTNGGETCAPPSGAHGLESSSSSSPPWPR
eukprot:8157288-Lingulodinium_polyedra.AAC.1